MCRWHFINFKNFTSSNKWNRIEHFNITSVLQFSKTSIKRISKFQTESHRLAGPPDDFFDVDEAFDSVFIQLWDLMLLVAPWPTVTSADRLLPSERVASDRMFGFKSEPGTISSHIQTTSNILFIAKNPDATELTPAPVSRNSHNTVLRDFLSTNNF